MKYDDIIKIEQLYKDFKINKKDRKKALKVLEKLYMETDLTLMAITSIANALLLIIWYDYDNLKLCLKSLEAFMKISIDLQLDIITILNDINHQLIITVDSKILDRIIFNTIYFIRKTKNINLAFKLLHEILISVSKVNHFSADILSRLYLEYLKQVSEFIETYKSGNNIYMKTVESCGMVSRLLND